jgi:hypothetical protein
MGEILRKEELRGKVIPAFTFPGDSTFGFLLRGENTKEILELANKICSYSRARTETFIIGKLRRLEGIEPDQREEVY